MRWIGWLAKLAITVVMVSMLTVMTTGYVVNTYIQSLLGSYNLPIANKTPSLGGMMLGMLGFGGDKKNEKEAGNEKTGGASLDGEADRADGTSGMDAANGTAGIAGSGGANGNDKYPGTSGTGGTRGAKGTNATNGTAGITGGEQQDANDNTEGTGGDEAPEDALSVMGGISGGSGASGSSQDALGQDQQVVVTPDEMVAKKDELSDKDKEEVFAMLMSKLPQAEMQKMTEAMEEGLTETEMIDIEQILSKYLDKAEYSKMMKILNG